MGDQKKMTKKRERLTEILDQCNAHISKLVEKSSKSLQVTVKHLEDAQ